ncbi:MAG: methyl-accepting chemotaxis protein [Gallionella sp.]
MKTKTLLNIVAGFGGFGMLILAAIALFQVSLLSDYSNQALHQSEQTTRALVSVESAAVEFKRQVQEWKDILLRGNDTAKFDKYLANFEKREAKMDDSLRAASATFSELGSVEKVHKIQSIIQLHQALGANYREALKSYVKTDPLTYRTVDKLVAGMDRALTDELSGFVADVEKESSLSILASKQVVNDKQRAATLYFGLFVLLASLLVYAAGRLVANRVCQRLGGEPKAAAEVALAVANGDLSIEVPQAPAVSLMGAMGKMKQDLLEIVGAFAVGVKGTQDSSVVLASTVNEINANTSVQADATASIAATIEEISASLQNLSVSADSARALSHQTGQEATQGGELIKNVASDVKAIAGHAQLVSNVVSELELHQKNVSLIVKVIDEIANQTNLLALNAAIEAARAGEQGRGFAVVADEVRNLAERTGKSTREIRNTIEAMHNGTSAAGDKINQMLASVGESVANALVAEQAIIRIIDMAGHSSIAVTDITSALHEQSHAVNDIALKIENVAQMSDANRQKVKLLSTNADRLSDVSGNLLKQVRRFKLHTTSGFELA